MGDTVTPLTVTVPAPTAPTVSVAPPTVPGTLVVPVAGPPGPTGAIGPSGAGSDGQPRFAGQGPPPVMILDAHPGDCYLDTLTGELYQLT